MADRKARLATVASMVAALVIAASPAMAQKKPAIAEKRDTGTSDPATGQPKGRDAVDDPGSADKDAGKDRDPVECRDAASTGAPADPDCPKDDVPDPATGEPAGRDSAADDPGRADKDADKDRTPSNARTPRRPAPTSIRTARRTMRPTPAGPGASSIVLPDILVDLFGGPKRLPPFGDGASAQPGGGSPADAQADLSASGGAGSGAAIPIPQQRPSPAATADPASRRRRRRKPAAGRLAARGQRRLRARRSAGHHRRRRRRRPGHRRQFRPAGPLAAPFDPARRHHRPLRHPRRPAGRYRAGAACRRPAGSGARAQPRLRPAAGRSDRELCVQAHFARFR